MTENRILSPSPVRAVRRRLLAAFAAAATLAVLPASPSAATPVATDETTYDAYGRVFPDPHGCNSGQPGFSPWAKGQVCAFDFTQFSELREGMAFLERLFPTYIEFYQLDKDFDCRARPVEDPKLGCKEFRSSGLPVTVEEGGPVRRDKQPLYMVRVTDESVPNKNKKWFVFPLSIHGIERAGAEGGTRAVEDLATWALCEKRPDTPVCANEEPIPHPLLEGTPKRSVTAGEALKKSVIFFIYPNPDGWVRGDRTTGTQFYQRYNGNGVDLNRDWPAIGFTYRPYTPWSEPESRSFGRVLQAIGPKDEKGNPQWTGGIDLHGQLVDRAFSFTLLGGSQRPFDKNQRILQTVKGAWADAESRLAWSPLIKPNDAPDQPEDPRVYGVQWGTIWDTIAYTVTGDLGNWIDSPIGLGADGIDNEMSLSHVSNCGIGSCYDLDVEQLHIDGNKSLIYSMINYSLRPENTTFDTKGRVGYIHTPGVVSRKRDRIAPAPRFTHYPPQDDIDSFALDPTNEYIFEFDVDGPKQKTYNGGLEVILTCLGAQGVSPCAMDSAVLERRAGPEPNVQGEEWEVVNTYFNQSSIYIQSGKALHANYPSPGRYRVRIQGTPRPAGGTYSGSVHFKKEAAWPDPGQLPYRATNMNFWKDLKPFTEPGLEKLTAAEILRGRSWMKRYDSIVVTDSVWPKLARPLRNWVERFDGNLVLTDSALGMLTEMGVVDAEPQQSLRYAGYVNFATEEREVTYSDPLARKIDQPGAAEGSDGSEVHRRQTYEPVPIGFSIQGQGGGDSNNSPAWHFASSAWNAAKGEPRAVGTTGGLANVSLGEIALGGGRIRIIGALLPMPTDGFDHPYGLSSYALTYSGYQLLLNALSYTR